MGPGKAELLEAIARTGSISGAAREMGMSYRRAWTLVETMNKAFRAPLVDAAIGGAHGGGARLSPAGEDALRRYRAMEEKAAASVEREMAEFAALLRPEWAEEC
jgi:molybdate transport system regulatory protein